MGDHHMTMDVARTKAAIGSGLLAFPVTHFDASGAFDEPAYRANIRANLEHGPAALFAPGGTGEFFSLTLAESERVVRAAVAEAGGRVPIIAGAGYGTSMAIEFARAAERAGADGILLLPQYLLNVEQEGLRRHVEAVCKSVGIAVVVYNRDNSIFAPETLEKLVATCPNLVGFKDGHGDVEQLMRVRQRLSDRLVYVGGMPTAEVFAIPYLAAGFTTYSSAVFNFVPKIAQRFYKAVRSGDTKTTDPMLRNFFEPYLALRNRKRGYAVSIVKAGMRIVGRPAGPVRAPLTDLTDAETEELRKIMVAGLGENFA
jgi:5-dehydro-4-deoxyglucarate dehydratase